MPCCGGKRAALKEQTKISQSTNTRPVRYTGSQTITIQGPVTGIKYVFSSQQPLQYVDIRDAAYFSDPSKIHQAFV
jgi:hypothetical protein